MNKKELLQKINYILSNANTSTDSSIIKCEQYIIEYLDTNPTDKEVWYNLVVLELIPPLADDTKAIELLNKIWRNFRDIKALIYVVVIQDIHSYISFKYINVLLNNLEIISDNKTKAMINYAIALYYIQNSDEQKAKKYLTNALHLQETFPNAYKLLFESQTADTPINSLDYTTDDYDWLSLENFENEEIFGYDDT